MLGTIAALYAVAASWLPLPLPLSPPPPAAEPPDKTPPTTTTANSSGDVRTTDANAGPSPRQDAPAPAESRPRATTPTRRPHQPSAGSPAAAAAGVHEPPRRYHSSRPEPRLLDEENSQVGRRPPSVLRRDQPLRPPQADGVVDGVPREHRSSGGNSNNNSSASASDNATEAFRAINRAAEENVRLRERAERAERMLETTRGRLCRALEDGVASAAAAESNAALNPDGIHASRRSFHNSNSNSSSSGSSGGSSGSSVNSSSSVLGARKRDDSNGASVGRRLRGRSPEQGARKQRVAMAGAGAGAGVLRAKTRRRRRSRSSSSSSSGSSSTSCGRADERSSSCGRVDERSESRRRHTSTLPAASSSCGTWEGESQYHSDATGERRQRRWRVRELGTGPAVAAAAAAVTEEEGHRRRHRRRRHSVSALRRHGTSEEETIRDEGGGGHGHGGRGGEDDRGVAREDQQRQQSRREQEQEQEQELRASDLARMREVVARLRVATRELEAERARRRVDQVHAAPTRAFAGGGVDEEIAAAAAAAAPILQDECECSQQRPHLPRVMAPAGVGQGGAAAVTAAESEEESAAVLLRENASLRRRLFGLAAVEELETRAVREGLLPLTGGGAPGGDLFSPSP